MTIRILSIESNLIIKGLVIDWGIAKSILFKFKVKPKLCFRIISIELLKGNNLLSPDGKTFSFFFSSSIL